MSHDKRGNGSTSVVDFNEARAQRLDEKRRKTERIFFERVLGVYCVMGEGAGNTQMRSVEIVDVSETGCSFQVPFDAQSPWPKGLEQFPLRLYFSQDTYLPVQVKILNSRPSIEQGRKYVRYGCEIDQTVSSYEAYVQFVRFLHSYSEHAHRDKGDVTLFYI